VLVGVDGAKPSFESGRCAGLEEAKHLGLAAVGTHVVDPQYELPPDGLLRISQVLEQQLALSGKGAVGPQRRNKLITLPLEHVAAGRHLSAEQVEAAAKGRVWSGEEAKEKGLVDELGGYDVALRLAKEAAKIPADKPFTLTVFPREKGTIERIYDRVFNAERERDAASPAAAEGVEIGMAAGIAKVLAGIETLVRDPGVLRMPPLGEIR